MLSSDIASMSDEAMDICPHCGSEIGPVICCLPRFLWWEQLMEEADRLHRGPADKEEKGELR